MARKSTVASRSEYVTVIYGIHTATKTVRRVYVQRDGRMVGNTTDGMQVTHYVAGGRRPESEAVIVFGLSDVFSVPINIADSEGTKRTLEQLRVKAQSQGDPAPHE